MPHPWSPPKFAAPLEKSKKICMFHHIVEVKQPHPMKPNGKAGSRGHRRNSPPHKAIFPPLQMTKPPGINGSGRLSLFSQGPCVSPFPPEASPEPPNRDSIRSKVLGGCVGCLGGVWAPYFIKAPSPPSIFRYFFFFLLLPPPRRFSTPLMILSPMDSSELDSNSRRSSS